MMAWAIFHRECNWARPNSRFSFNAKASSEPQQRPRDFIEYCVGKGWAEEVPPPSRTEAEALKPKRKRAK
ncbi:hypothetical protein [Aminobacter sp. BE110]|uniref:hypothetical protein n=2 Tax=Aminobacter TaxID=31988 RepID=UPI003D2438C5